jgi:hypothetical protein
MAAAAGWRRSQHMEELIKYMKALVYLQVQSIAGTSAFGKPEVLLSKAGFKAREIGDILGKKEAAVAKTLSRAKLNSKEDADE